MSKRLVTWLTAAGLLLTAVVVGWYSYNGGTYVVRIKAAEAQARVDAMLARRAESGPRSINVSNVVVVFADDQVYIDAHVTGTKLGRKVQTDIHAVGKPRYSGGSFYFTPTAPVEFKNAKVEKVESGKKPFFEKTRELLKKKVDVFIINTVMRKSLRVSRANLKSGQKTSSNNSSLLSCLSIRSIPSKTTLRVLPSRQCLKKWKPWATSCKQRFRSLSLRTASFWQ